MCSSIEHIAVGWWLEKKENSWLIPLPLPLSRMASPPSWDEKLPSLVVKS